jgi:hypothetical protein
MNKITGFLRKHDFLDPRPSFWNLVMLFYFANTILFAVPLPIPFPAPFYAGFALALMWFPGFWYSFGEFVKVIDVKDSTLVRVRNVMGICFVTFVFFGGVLRSANNMAASIGGEFPLYLPLGSLGRVAEPVLAFVIGIGAVLIRRKLPFSPFKVQEAEQVEEPPGQRSLARVLEGIGLLLILLSLPVGLFDIVAMEALILLVTGLILFPTGFLIRKITRPTSSAPASALP